MNYSFLLLIMLPCFRPKSAIGWTLRVLFDQSAFSRPLAYFVLVSFDTNKGSGSNYSQVTEVGLSFNYSLIWIVH